MGDKVSQLNEANFEKEVLEAEKPVLVDFWAAWCSPCRMIAPVLEEIAEEYGDKLKVAKLNVDDSSAIAERYEVRSIPTLIVFEDGKEKQRFVGAIPKQKLVEELSSWLK